MNQVKNILLKWTIFLTKSLIKISSHDIKKISTNDHNKDSLKAVLQTSPFLSIHHIIKDFLMKDLIKIGYNESTFKNKNISSINPDQDEEDSIKKKNQPMLSLYMKMNNNQYSNSFQTINGLLTYLKIINYYLINHPFLVIQQILQKLKIEIPSSSKNNSSSSKIGSESSILLNLSFLDFLLIFYLSLMDVINSTTKKISKKRKEKKVKEWREDEIEIIMDSTQTIRSSSSSSSNSYIMIFNKRKMTIIQEMENLVKKILIKIKYNKVASVKYPIDTIDILYSNISLDQEHLPRNNNIENKNKNGSFITNHMNNNSVNNNNNINYINNNNDNNNNNNSNSNINNNNSNNNSNSNSNSNNDNDNDNNNNNNNNIININIDDDDDDDDNNNNNNNNNSSTINPNNKPQYIDKQDYDKEAHLKLKLKLLWVDLNNDNL
ncbi:hypothetical protein PIROE2DRAFT_3723 [Piromyces sp. E2]|nr:hypothetical protein PIROE2DRAFT_3723 [Piromyces sp. E2]|eukprot:OUM68576.1 hypothetical protein PIROE2DRAFT_3723 [Piromyces sp. E2]